MRPESVELRDAHMTIDVEGLRGPEEEDGEEVGAGDSRDDEGQSEDTRLLAKARREHWEFGELCFPDDEDDEDCRPEQQRHEDMGRLPAILGQISQALVSTPRRPERTWYPPH